MTLVFVRVFVFFSMFCFIQLSSEKDIAKEFEDILESQPYVAALITKECCACTGCVEAETLLAVMQEEIAREYNVVLVKLIEQPAIAKDYGVKDYPSLIFLRNREPALYVGPFEKEALLDWFAQSREVALKKLDDSSFEHLTQASTGATTGDWLVAFHDSTCGELALKTMLDGLAVRVKGRVLVAHVDIESSPDVKERFNIVKCPTLIFFRQGKMYFYDLPTTTPSSLQSFVEGFYRNARSVPVPVPKSPFDKLVGEALVQIKTNPMLVFMAIGGFLLFIATLYGISEKKSPKGPKEQKRD